MTVLSRRAILLTALALAYCSDDEPDAPGQFAALRYDYLPPIQLNVATIDIEDRYIPSGIPPDVSGDDPAPPIATLQAMAKDRIQAFGTSDRATFAVLDASITRIKDVIRGQFAVSLTIFDNDSKQLGYAQAHVERSRTGGTTHLRQVLYDMTKAMMDDMNIEMEYQIRRNLKEWLTNAAAPDTPVQQDPLERSPTN